MQGAIYILDSHLAERDTNNHERHAYLSSVRKKHDLQNQSIEANLDIVLDRLRQCASNEVINHVVMHIPLLFYCICCQCLLYTVYYCTVIYCTIASVIYCTVLLHCHILYCCICCMCTIALSYTVLLHCHILYYCTVIYCTVASVACVVI